MYLNVPPFNHERRIEGGLKIMKNKKNSLTHTYEENIFENGKGVFQQSQIRLGPISHGSLLRLT